MKVVYKLRAKKAIAKVAEYIESQNTEGSGERWTEKLALKIESLARSKARFAPCRNSSLARLKYSCFAYDDWIIAFRMSEKKFEVCRFIYGPRLE